VLLRSNKSGWCKAISRLHNDESLPSRLVVVGYGSTLMTYKLVKAAVKMPKKPSSGVTLLMVIVRTNATVAIAISAVTVGRVAISKTNFICAA